jgi:hypothetical protein
MSKTGKVFLVLACLYVIFGIFIRMDRLCGVGCATGYFIMDTVTFRDGWIDARP